MSSSTSSLHLPRILCLHGGGTNARIFRAQCRALKAHIGDKFRLCFAQAPLPSLPGPDVVSVYNEWGPFKAWIPSHLTIQDSSDSDSDSDSFPWAKADNTHNSSLDSETATSLVMEAVEKAMYQDDETGASGPWVGVLGFSQGAKLAASILLAQQTGGRNSQFGFRFGILLAGRAPLVALHSGVQKDGETVVDVNDEMPEWATRRSRGKKARLRVPTVHVLGKKDPNYRLHRGLYEGCCETSSTRLMEWDGGHRVPIQTKDVTKLANQIMDVAKETGMVFNE